MEQKNKIILAIDPGLRITGFSILQLQLGKITLIECGYIKLDEKKEIPYRIKQFFDFFSNKITVLHVTDIALETPFLSKNVSSFLKLGYLKSITYLLSEQYNLILHEFAPRIIKQTITGYGGAEKEQVAKTLHQLFPNLKKIDIKKYDITDAIAIALCALWKK